MATESKKLALLRILQILEDYSDADHPMTQGQISEKLLQEYGIELERKAIASNISLLKEAGYEIETMAVGCYLVARTFEDSELRLLIDSVIYSRFVPKKQTEDLVDKLAKLSNKKFYTDIKHIHMAPDWRKQESPAIFLNIEIISEAMEKEKKISFAYKKYNSEAVLELYSCHEVTPIQMIVNNSEYYLMALSEKEKLMVFKLSRMCDITVLKRAKAIPQMRINQIKASLDPKLTLSEFPMLTCFFYSELETFELLCSGYTVDAVVSEFGKDIKVEKFDEIKSGEDAVLNCDFNTAMMRKIMLKHPVKISVKSTSESVTKFILNNFPDIYLLSPDSEREKLIRRIEEIMSFNEKMERILEEQ